MTTQMELLYLDETQNATFDNEYHLPEEMECKLRRLELLYNEKAFTILDVGGGNGKFLDGLLSRFPPAKGTLIDISRQLLRLNRQHPRKALLICNVDSLDDEFPPNSFDVITLNWLLHHLVGPSYAACRDNCRIALLKCKSLLKIGGVIIITENMFEGIGESNLPSWMIYMITSVRSRWFVAMIRRWFHTAGVGVCFRSSQAWREVFHESGLEVIYDDLGHVWDLTFPRKVMFTFLGIRQVAHRHFYLKVSDANTITPIAGDS
jgi:ubiquinone/menaquinone biosynthesis C-methylase UbiE